MGNGKWEMEDGKSKKEEGRWGMGNGKWEMEDGKSKKEEVRSKK